MIWCEGGLGVYWVGRWKKENQMASMYPDNKRYVLMRDNETGQVFVVRVEADSLLDAVRKAEREWRLATPYAASEGGTAYFKKVHKAGWAVGDGWMTL